MARKAERRELLAKRDELRALVRSGVSSYAQTSLHVMEQRLVDEQGYEWALDGSGVAVPQGMGRSADAPLPDAGVEGQLCPDSSVSEGELFRTGGSRKGRTGMEVGIGASQAASIGSADSSTAPTMASNAGTTAEGWGEFGTLTASVPSTASASVAVSSTSAAASATSIQIGATLPPPPHPHIKVTPMRAAATNVPHSASSLAIGPEPTSTASFLLHPLSGIAAAVGSILHRTPGPMAPISMQPVSPAETLPAASAATGPSRVVVSPLVMAAELPAAARSGAAQKVKKSASATTPLVMSAVQVSTSVSTTAAVASPVPGVQVLPSIETVLPGHAPPGAPPTGSS